MATITDERLQQLLNDCRRTHYRPPPLAVPKGASISEFHEDVCAALEELQRWRARRLR